MINDCVKFKSQFIQRQRSTNVYSVIHVYKLAFATSLCDCKRQNVSHRLKLYLDSYYKALDVRLYSKYVCIHIYICMYVYMELKRVSINFSI